MFTNHWPNNPGSWNCHVWKAVRVLDPGIGWYSEFGNEQFLKSQTYRFRIYNPGGSQSGLVRVVATLARVLLNLSHQSSWTRYRPFPGCQIQWDNVREQASVVVYMRLRAGWSPVTADNIHSGSSPTSQSAGFPGTQHLIPRPIASEERHKRSGRVRV